MAKAVLDTSLDSVYDDEIAQRYHFPSRYLQAMERCVGDWVVFRQPRAGGGSKAYFAIAHLDRITEDVKTSGHFYARLSRFLEFDEPTPWKPGGEYAEEVLRGFSDVPQVGVYLRGRSVRPLSDADFARIVDIGLAETLEPENAVKLGLTGDNLDPATSELLAAPEAEQERRIVQILMNKKIRAASFRNKVCKAYDNTCAVTGIKVVNGKGRAEAQAAHIWSVADGGPDSTRNGIALSGTVHWLFDRHLISIAPDYSLLVAHNRIPTQLLALFEERKARLHLPEDRSLWPNPGYVARHRERFMS